MKQTRLKMDLYYNFNELFIMVKIQYENIYVKNIYDKNVISKFCKISLQDLTTQF
jgi:hypothetical protein